MLSLVSSHAIGDALWISYAIADAVNGLAFDTTCAADQQGELRRLWSDAVSAAIRISRLGATHLGRSIQRNGRAVAPVDPTGDSTVRESWPEPGPDWALPKIYAVLSEADWHAAGQARGGTSTSLSVALIAALAGAIGRTAPGGAVSMRVPFSTRTPDSPHANAVHSKGLRFDVPVTDTMFDDLRTVRKTIKQAATDLPSDDSVIPALLLSRESLAQAIERPDYLTTICSPVNSLQTEILTIDGRTAVGFWMGVVAERVDRPDRITRMGGTLRLLTTEVGGTVGLQISAHHPPAVVDRASLIAQASEIFLGFGLRPRIF